MSPVTYDPAPRTNVLSFVLRGADIEAVWDGVAHHGLSTQRALRDSYTVSDEQGGTNDELLRNALDFLRIIRVLDRRAPDRAGEQTYDVVLPAEERALPFRLLLLRQLRRLDEQRGAFAVVQRFVTAENLGLTTVDELRAGVERADKSVTGLNREKLNFWRDLAAYCGLIQPVEVRDGSRRSSSVLCVPSVQLLLDLLAHYQSTHPGPNTPVRSWLEFIDQRFFATRTRKGAIHDGLGQAILGLEECHLARLDSRSDDPEATLVLGKSVSRVTLL